METNKPTVRLTRPNDINHLRDLDIKCYPYPLEMQDWHKLVNGAGKKSEARVIIVEWNGTPIGFAVWNYEQIERKDKQGQTETLDVAYVVRLGVAPAYRRRNVGMLLRDTVLIDARKKSLDVVRMTVPDLHCNPGDPDDVSVWLNRMGFRATGEIKERFMVMYGDWREGYIFESPVT